jgi:hypothetical protein
MTVEQFLRVLHRENVRFRKQHNACPQKIKNPWYYARKLRNGKFEIFQQTGPAIIRPMSFKKFKTTPVARWAATAYRAAKKV